MELSSRSLAKWIADFDVKNCEAQYFDAVKLRIFDLMISTVAGWKINKGYNRAVNSVFFSFAGSGQSTTFFSGQKLPAPTAAYLNATYGHGADIDDGHRTANGHPGVSLIPAVLALAESEGSDADAVFTAIIVGYEIYIRLSRAVQPSLLRRGFHGTGVVGAVAAAGACAKLLGLDEDGIHDAMSMGAVQASGLFEVSESGQQVKPVNPANACRVGLESALLSRAGIDAPCAPFEGVKGFFKAFCDDPHPERITDGLGKELLIETCYIKLSPACRHMHPSIDAGIELFGRRKITPDIVQSIEIETYANAEFVTGKITKPTSVDEGKFSMRYALAMALQYGRYSFGELEQTAKISDDTSRLIDKMHITVDSAYENPAKNIRGGRVTVNFLDGSHESCYVPVPRGELTNPLGPEDMLNKMKSCCEGVLSSEAQQRLYECVMGKSFDLSALVGVMGIQKQL